MYMHYAYFEYIFITTLRMKGRLERILACTGVPYFHLMLLATLIRLSMYYAIDHSAFVCPLTVTYQET